MNKLKQKLDHIKEEGKIFNSIEFSSLGEMTPQDRHTEIVKKIIKFTRKTLHYKNIALWELHSEKEQLVPLFSRGYGGALRKYRLKPSEFNNGIVGYVASTGYPYIARNLMKDPHYLPGLRKAQASVTVPFKVAREVFGVLNIESVRRSAFDMDDIKLLKEYAGYVAVALNIRRILDIGERITVARISKTLSHEVNNPLSTIFMTLGKIDAEKEKLSEHMIGLLRAINQNLNLIKSAVEKLSSIDSIRMDEEYEIIDIEDTLTKKKVLVIEDDCTVRKSIREMLEKEGCITDEAKDGKEGVEMALTNRYGVIITDIKMPHKSGYDVFREIRSRKKDQKVIMMTGFGYDESHTIVKCSEQGLNGVLYKPFTPELFRKVLTRVCT